MPLTLDGYDMALRLTLTVLVGLLFGVNRNEKGRAAGLATTVLVGLAACVAMIQTNLLLGLAGKSPDSFITLDLMRLPLGILTGMGFLGAGVILRRGEVIRGITTAATLWLVTVISLCFGGGQLVVGSVASLLGLLILWGLKPLEAHLKRDHRATLILHSTEATPTEEEIRSRLLATQCRIVSWDVTHVLVEGEPRRVLRCGVERRGGRDDLQLPAAVEQLMQHPSVQRLRWKTEN